MCMIQLFGYEGILLNKNYDVQFSKIFIYYVNVISILELLFISILNFRI